MTKSEKIKTATKLGLRAFENGIKCAPILDKDLMKLLVNNKVGEGILIMKAWVRSWTEANLNQVI